MSESTLDNLKARFRGWLLARKCISALLDQPHLWRWNRRGVARGAAVGVFLGFVLPFGQIPASAVCAKYLRLNLPVTVAGTWITNPITTVPIYYAIYLFGAWLLGPMASAPAESMEAGLLDRITSVSIPILVATPIVALACAPLTYAAVSFVYRIRVRRRHRRQRTLRGASI